MDCSYGRASFGAFLVSLLRVWLESGIPPTLSVVGVCSALSPPLWFSAPVGIRVQPVLQRISGGNRGLEEVDVLTVVFVDVSGEL